MRPSIVVSCVLAAGAFVLGRASLAGEPCAKPVPAKKYRVSYAESVLDAVHGGARWIHGIYLVEGRVAASLRFPWEFAKDGNYSQYALLQAHASDKPDNDVTGWLSDKPSETTDITIPADLAQQIKDLAALSDRVHAEERRLGQEVRTRLKLEPIPDPRDQ